MKNKTNLILVGVLAVLVVLVAAPRVYKQFKSKSAVEIALFEKPIDYFSYSTIVISDNDRTLELKKVNGVWSVVNFPADAQKMNDMLTSFRDMTITEVAAKSASSHSRLGVTQKDGSFVILKDSATSPEVSFYIGNFVRVTSTFFVRRGDQDIVYLANSGAKDFVSAERTNWLSKIMADVNPADVHKITWSRGGVNVLLKRIDDSNWQAFYGNSSFKFASDRLTETLHNLNTLNADLFITDPGDVKTFMNVRDSMSYTVYGLKDKVLYNANLYSHGDQWWTKVPADPTLLYYITKVNFEKVTPSQDSLK